MGKIVTKIEDGIIHTVYPLEMTTEDANLYISELKAAIGQFTDKVKILTDVSNAEVPGPEAKNIIAEGIRGHKHRIEKSAVCGVDSAFKRIATKLVMALSGRSDIHIFAGREEAIAWLKE